ncbi:hypothetical protein [Streptomyces sp. PSAA01]|uniref:hypothetical protein n=1 Tax=Streptomyces sp. PSAA01 TaxID=2912762 RepID=UPI001F4474B7|nr:hypothetical protein [Streptomyces sp. PSAA01]
MIGDEILVKGTIGPYFDVTTRLVRLRLLNGSNARLYHFGFADDRSFSLVATEGGLLAEPWETDRLYLSPGERAEIVVAFEPGERVEPRSSPSEYGGLLGRLDGLADRLDICQFRAAGTLADDAELPAELGVAPDLAGDAVAKERSFTLASDQINGRSMAMDRIDFGVREGTVEAWEVTNDNGLTITSTVKQMKDRTCVFWEGPAIGKSITIDKGTHLWTFTETDEGTLVHTEESWDAELLDSLKGPDHDAVANMLGGGLDIWLKALKTEAETSHGRSS